MRRLTKWMLAASVLPLVGCSQTGIANDGAGYKLLSPNAQTRSFIVSNDIDFARQVAAHNAQCRKDLSCLK